VRELWKNFIYYLNKDLGGIAMAQITVIGFANENLSNAEKKVLNSIKKLPDNYYIIYGKINLTETNEKLKDAETDFIVISPDSKILVIEVKGGGIERDGGEWFSIDRNKERHRITDPYAQSLKNKNSIIKELSRKGFEINFYYGIGHAVWFPDINFNQDLSGMENGSEITLDERNLQNPEDRIKNILNHWCGNKTQYRGNAKEILNALCPKVMVRKKLGMFIGEEEEYILIATEEQKNIANAFISNNNKGIVKGCAGSGKTILASYISSEMARNNKRVLLCCFNKHLENNLRMEIIDDQNIDILCFHELCRRIIIRSGRKLPNEGDNKDIYNNETLPYEAFDSLEKFKERYDVIIVDEGQDFKSDWWLILEELLKDKKNSKFFIFADDNQNIYRGNEYPQGMPVFPLTKNCRNTKKINEASLKFYKNDTNIIPISIREAEGEVQFISTNKNNLEQKLDDLVSKLIKEGIDYHSIVILTPHGEKTTALRGKTIAKKRLVWGNENGIKVSSIASFKGLESDIVILVEIDGIQEYNKLMYVAITRAKHNLYILSENDPIGQI
jgi:hypothetical protein